MDLVNYILNICAPPIIFIAISLCLPPLLLYRFFLSIFRILLQEDVAGKVVLITGASSGIGEHVAYEYAKRGACLALVARRRNRLQQVAEIARYLGAPEVIIISADVSRVQDCMQFIDETVNCFGRLDHLVNNAGISTMNTVEELTDITKATYVMDTNFWGSVYATHRAIPHLKNSRGEIIVTASSGAWLPVPRLAVYTASKAALISFYETLRTELRGDIGITVVTPGVTESELTKGRFLSKDGKMILDQEMRDVEVSASPVQPVEKCAKAIVQSACRGDRNLTVPSWMKMTLLWKVLMPEVMEWSNRMLLIPARGTPPTEAPSKKIADLPGAKTIMYPPYWKCSLLP